MYDNMIRLKTILQKNKYKLTTQREDVFKAILENRGKHMSAEEIFEEIRMNNPKMGLATVYRTLYLFEELGILIKHNFEDGRNRYELGQSEMDHDHHHLICLGCGEVSEVKEDLLDFLEDNIETNYGFRVANHKVKFYGYCKNCQ